MSTIHLRGRVEERFPVDYPPELAFRYFAGNEDLLRQFLGHDRIEKIAPGVFRVTLNRHGALGLHLRPSFDVEFVEHPSNRVEMRSLRASLVDATHDGTGFEAGFQGEALFGPDARGCEVHCWAEMHMAIALPAIFDWMPAHALEAVGNGVIRPAMATLGHRLVPIMQRDIHRWVAAQEAKPAADG